MCHDQKSNPHLSVHRTPTFQCVGPASAPSVAHWQQPPRRASGRFWVGWSPRWWQQGVWAGNQQQLQTPCLF